MANVALLCDSLTFVRQSHFSATAWTGFNVRSGQWLPDQIRPGLHANRPGLERFPAALKDDSVTL